MAKAAKPTVAEMLAAAGYVIYQTIVQLQLPEPVLLAAKGKKEFINILIVLRDGRWRDLNQEWKPEWHKPCPGPEDICEEGASIISDEPTLRRMVGEEMSRRILKSLYDTPSSSRSTAPNKVIERLWRAITCENR